MDIFTAMSTSRHVSIVHQVDAEHARFASPLLLDQVNARGQSVLFIGIRAKRLDVFIEVENVDSGRRGGQTGPSWFFPASLCLLDALELLLGNRIGGDEVRTGAGTAELPTAIGPQPCRVFDNLVNWADCSEQKQKENTKNDQIRLRNAKELFFEQACKSHRQKVGKQPNQQKKKINPSRFFFPFSLTMHLKFLSFALIKFNPLFLEHFWRLKMSFKSKHAAEGSLKMNKMATRTCPYIPLTTEKEKEK